MKVYPAKVLTGRIELPGDKSISHRAALLAAMATGRSVIENFATSEDCVSTLNCLKALGVSIDRNGSTVTIDGVGKTGFVAPAEPLDCGNSGTTMRAPFSGILAGQAFESVLTGDASLMTRPMKRIIGPLERMNARIESQDFRAPLKIHGRNSLRAINYDLPVSSAQVKSCVLLAGLNADGRSRVISPAASVARPMSRDHTEIMLEYLGAEISRDFVESDGGFSDQITISGSSHLTARDLQIPADISSAAFFLVAAACLEGSLIVLPNVGFNPTRTAILEKLRDFGADIEITDQWRKCGELASDLRVSGSGMVARAVNTNIINGEIIANLIDEIPVLAVFGTQVEGGIEIRGAEELRVKESDRIASTVENLRRMKADVEEFPDGLRVGKSRLRGARVDSFGDHRIAMAFGVAGLLAEGETEIVGHDCAAVSFPGFFEVLAGLAG